jgi:tetraacyldisaccharide 4'-kinase
MALQARTPTVFVGSAKSVAVAPYGRFEAATLARAAACFVRDEPTAQALRRQGVKAEAANAIVDLFATRSQASAEPAIAGFSPAMALFPGSRERAYADAEFLLEVTGELASTRPSLGAALSVAPGLDADRFAHDALRAGWTVQATAVDFVPFVLSRGGRETVRGWSGPLGPLIERVTLVLGQAGTANEAAAAGGVPVVAFERGRDRKAHWYRQRQQGLLGDALAVLPRERGEAVAGVSAILDDAARQKRMSEIGRARMGEPGATQRIAQRIAALLDGSRCDG